MSDSSLMDVLNFPDGVQTLGNETVIVDFASTRMYIRDYHELTRMIREYGETVTLGQLKAELLDVVRLTVQGATR